MIFRKRRLKRFCFLTFVTCSAIILFNVAYLKEAADAYQLLDVAKEFVQKAAEINLSVFLIDEGILQHINGSQKTDLQHWCNVICNSGSVILTFATTYFFNFDEEISRAFSSFQVIHLPSQPSPFYVDQGHSDSNHFHFLFVHKKTNIVFHLVVFHEITGGLYYHSHIRMEGVNVSHTSHITYGATHIGIYDRKSLRTVPLTMEEFSIRIPSDINQFLRSKEESQYVSCNNSLAQQFKAKYGKEESNDMDFKIFKEEAKNLLATISEALHYHGIPFWISSGTCLGWFRQCDLISYSKDVDVGIWIDDYLPNMVDAVETSGLTLISSFGKVNDSYELSFTNGHLKLDIFFFYKERDHMWNGGTQAKTGKKFKYLFKKFQLCWTLLLDIIVRVPCDTKQYIKDNYGDEWFQPVKHWDWKESPSNVFENGKWPEQEWNDVIKIF